MKVDPDEARHVISELEHLKPYLTQLEFDSDIDFLYLLNGVTTKVVFTARDDRADLVSRMIRDICESEGMVDHHNKVNPTHITQPTETEETKDQTSVIQLSHPAEVEERTPANPSSPSISEERAEEIRVAPPDVVVIKDPATSISKAKKRRIRRTTLEKNRDRTSQMRAEFSNLNISNSRQVNSAMKNVKYIQTAVRRDANLAKRAITAKIKHFEYFETKIVKLLGHEAGELIPLQTFVSNVADLDWVRYRGVADKINRLTDRLLE